VNKKILLPYISRSGHNIHSKTVGGGIEKFVKNIYEVFPYSIPVEITSEDRSKGNTQKIFNYAFRKHKPDIIIVNDIDTCFTVPMIKLGIPTIAIVHEPLARDIRYVAWWKDIHKFIGAGGHLYFVSENQKNFHNKNIERISNKPLIGIKGTINSSFSDGSEFVPKKKHFLYDAVTIGRTDLTKNPFLLHKKLQPTNLSSCVITSGNNFQHSDNQKKYWNDNLHWEKPQYTFRGLNHKDTMKTMSEAACYVSTCSVESWGITVLEALLHGVPVIILSDKSGEHSSKIIPADPDHFKILHKNVSSEELAETIDMFKSRYRAYEDRLAISDATKNKHSKEKWIDKIKEMVYHSKFNIPKHSSLTRFFT